MSKLIFTFMVAASLICRAHKLKNTLDNEYSPYRLNVSMDGINFNLHQVHNGFQLYCQGDTIYTEKLPDGTITDDLANWLKGMGFPCEKEQMVVVDNEVQLCDKGKFVCRPKLETFEISQRKYAADEVYEYSDFLKTFTCKEEKLEYIIYNKQESRTALVREFPFCNLTKFPVSEDGRIHLCNNGTFLCNQLSDEFNFFGFQIVVNILLEHSRNFALFRCKPDGEIYKLRTFGFDYDGQRRRLDIVGYYCMNDLKTDQDNKVRLCKANRYVICSTKVIKLGRKYYNIDYLERSWRDGDYDQSEYVEFTCPAKTSEKILLHLTPDKVKIIYPKYDDNCLKDRFSPTFCDSQGYFVCSRCDLGKPFYTNRMTFHTLQEELTGHVNIAEKFNYTCKGSLTKGVDSELACVGGILKPEPSCFDRSQIDCDLSEYDKEIFKFFSMNGDELQHAAAYQIFRYTCADNYIKDPDTILTCTNGYVQPQPSCFENGDQSCSLKMYHSFGTEFYTLDGEKLTDFVKSGEEFTFTCLTPELHRSYVVKSKCQNGRIIPFIRCA